MNKIEYNGKEILDIDKVNQTIFVSATPAEYELEHSKEVAEQIIRPTGLLDPNIIIKPVKGQIDDLYEEDMDMSLFDEDEMECEYCGHIGLMFNGDFDVECPVCGAEYSLINEDEE